MLLGFNGSTTMRATLLEDIEHAEAAGFDLLEIWAPKLRAYLKRHSLTELRREFAGRRIRPLSINSIERITFCPNYRETRRVEEELDELGAAAHALGCPYLVVTPSFLTKPVPRAAVIKETVSRLRALSEQARNCPVSLAFEFLGLAHCSVNTLDLAWEIVAQVHRKNVGLVLDTFHFFAGGSELKSILKLNRKKLFILEFNDAPARPAPGKLLDRHRLYPGDGVIPLKQILARLDRIGYHRLASLELANPGYWRQPPARVTKTAMQKCKQAIGA
jgi:2-keto-myo-inositol isomerase